MITANVNVELTPYNIAFDRDNDAFDFIVALDESVGTLEFTVGIYEYAKKVLLGEGYFDE